MSSPKYKIQFPIGDWSDDGHGKCDWFLIESNKTVEELRELHFSCPSKTGIEIGDLCRHYEDYFINAETTKKLRDLNVLTNATKNTQSDDPDYKEDEFCPGNYKGSETLLLIWLELLKCVDPSFEYTIVYQDAPTINFYGFDQKNRHLNTPGYGLFS